MKIVYPTDALNWFVLLPAFGLSLRNPCIIHIIINTPVPPHQSQIQMIQYNRVAKWPKATTGDVDAMRQLQLFHVTASVNAH